MTLVSTFNDCEKAQVVKNCLEKAGISASLADESKLQRYFFLSKSLASHKVYVADEDFGRARQCLKEADAAHHILTGEIRCPQCASARIEYPQFTRKFMTTTLVQVGCLLKIIDKTFYCMDCHFTWPAAVSLRKKLDVLNWPVPHDGLVRQEKG